MTEAGKLRHDGLMNGESTGNSEPDEIGAAACSRGTSGAVARAAWATGSSSSCCGTCAGTRLLLWATVLAVNAGYVGLPSGCVRDGSAGRPDSRRSGVCVGDMLVDAEDEITLQAHESEPGMLARATDQNEHVIDPEMADTVKFIFLCGGSIGVGLSCGHSLPPKPNEPEVDRAAGSFAGLMLHVHCRLWTPDADRLLLLEDLPRAPARGTAPPSWNSARRESPAGSAV